MAAAHDTLFAGPEAPGLAGAQPLGIAGPVDPVVLDEGKARHFFLLERWWEALETLGVCLFVPVPRGALPVEMVVQALQGVTGQPLSLDEVLAAGARGTDLARLFNVREGLTAGADRLPARLFQSNTIHPGLDQDDLRRAVAAYYAQRGWDAGGVPPQANPDRGTLTRKTV